MGSTVVKICGLTNLDDARVAVDAGADLLGFIFYAKSPRYVAAEVAATIVRTLRADDKMTTVNGALRPLRDGETAALRQRPSSIVHRQSSIVNRQSSIVNRQSPRVVGVFVNASIAEIQAVVDSVGLDLVQLHGNETAEWFAPLGGRAYKALRPADAATAEVQAAYFAPLGCADGPALMIDAYDSGAYGGTGKQTDWHVAAALARRHPGLLLAGGLTPENVTTAIDLVRPWGVDVASGVEAKPGQKDHEKVRRFVAEVRSRLQ